MSAFSEGTLAWMAVHAIDPARAADLGVRENGRGLEFPNGRVRSPDGPKTLQPKGQPLEPWQVCGDRSASTWLYCEGEGDALAAATHLPATPLPAQLKDLPVFSIPGTGCPPARLVDLALTAGAAQVVLAFDADVPGRKYTDKMTEALLDAGLQVAVVVLPDGCDLADVLARADDPADTLANLIVDAEPVALEVEEAPPAPTTPAVPPEPDTLLAESFALIRAERTRWLWDGRIPLGTATLLAGREKLGKSTLTDELGAQLSRGQLPGDLAGSPAATLIVTYEDSAARTIKPRLMAAGADLSRVHHVRASATGDLVTLPADVEALGRLAARTGARLIVVDPLSASLGADVDGHRDQDIRRAIAPLAALAERLDLAVLCLAHLNKSQAGDALSRVLGSRGLTAAVRSVLTFGRAPDADEDSPERVLAHAASNLAPEAPSLAYRHEGREVHGQDGEAIPTNRLVLLGECDTRADDLIVTRSSDERSDTEAAADWLADELRDGGWHESRHVKASAKAEGISDKVLRRAREQLAVEFRREGLHAVSEWRLPAVVPSPSTSEGTTGEGTTTQTLSTSGIEPDSSSSHAPSQIKGTTKPDGLVNGWTDEAACAFIEQAKRSFPGSHEVAS